MTKVHEGAGQAANAERRHRGQPPAEATTLGGHWALTVVAPSETVGLRQVQPPAPKEAAEARDISAAIHGWQASANITCRHRIVSLTA